MCVEEGTHRKTRVTESIEIRNKSGMMELAVQLQSARMVNLA